MHVEEPKSPWLMSNTGSEVYNQPLFGLTIQAKVIYELFFAPHKLKNSIYPALTAVTKLIYLKSFCAY